MLRLATFLGETAGVELVLSVIPSSYQWAYEAVVKAVAVGQLRDLNSFGGKRMGSTALYDRLLPVQAYPFPSPGTGTNPRLYLKQLGRWVDRETVVWWLASGTPVNAAVLLEEVTYREQDGTNDLHADTTLRQYARPGASVLSAESSASDAGMTTSRDSTIGAATVKTCTVANGDTPWGICRRHYGDGSLTWWLAAANGIANANLIHPDQVLTIPPPTQLPAAAIRPPLAEIAAVAKVWGVKEEESRTACLAPRAPENMMRSLTDLGLDKIASGGGL